MNCIMIIDLSTILRVSILSGSLLSILAWAEPLKGTNVTRTEEGRYSHVVSIAFIKDKLEAEKTNFCTGVLVRKNFVLTAAHCIANKLLGEIVILIGYVDLRKSKKYYPSMWITYEQWAERKKITKKNATNDIAMIKLSQKVFSLLARPVPVLFAEKNDLSNKDVVLVGWGRANASPLHSSRYLNEAKVKVLSTADCEFIAYGLYRRTLIVPDELFCTRGGMLAFLAEGDSGGPVLRNNSVVGISKGICPPTGTCDLPEIVVDNSKLNVHTSVHFYKNFITDVLKNY